MPPSLCPAANLWDTIRSPEGEGILGRVKSNLVSKPIDFKARVGLDLLLQGFEDVFRCNGESGKADPNRIVDCIGDGARHP